MVRKALHATDPGLLLMMLDTIADTARHVAPEVWHRMLEVGLDGLLVRRRGRSSLRVPALPSAKLSRSQRPSAPNGRRV